MLYKLINPIKHYAWGSKTELTRLFGIKNQENQPLAELWMGTHPNGCSKVESEGKQVLLSDLIKLAPVNFLGERTFSQFGELPYLMKILSAEKPLSIQVHPKKSCAESGFERENKKGLPIDSQYRNYKDANHKPELIFAITPFLAMNGFREIDEILSLFQEAECLSLANKLARLKEEPCSEQLKHFFKSILSLEGEQKVVAIRELLSNIEQKGRTKDAKIAYSLIDQFYKDYPEDVGLFAPLILNIIELKPNEAMFIHAETPHAYIKGTGIEIMANSDNVLRAGLTPKHIDVEELINNTFFESKNKQDIRTLPTINEETWIFDIPVNDFKFEIINLSGQHHKLITNSAEILFCIEGVIELSNERQLLILQAGESATVSANECAYQIKGHGRLARASN